MGLHHNCIKSAEDLKYIEMGIYGEQREIKCPNCNYGGEDLKIGRKPISNPMMCSKCKRYFNPFPNSESTVKTGEKDGN